MSEICGCCNGDPNTVCDACGEHARWAGRFMCEDAQTAGTRQLDAELAKAAAPVDWPARFRAAAGAAASAGLSALPWHLVGAADRLKAAPADVVEAIGRALLGETS